VQLHRAIIVVNYDGRGRNGKEIEQENNSTENPDNYDNYDNHWLVYSKYSGTRKLYYAYGYQYVLN
jgi:hypothetical protein